MRARVSQGVRRRGGQLHVHCSIRLVGCSNSPRLTLVICSLPGYRGSPTVWKFENAKIIPKLARNPVSIAFSTSAYQTVHFKPILSHFRRNAQKCRKYRGWNLWRHGLQIWNCRNYAKISSKSGFDCFFSISIPNYTGWANSQHVLTKIRKMQKYIVFCMKSEEMH